MASNDDERPPIDTEEYTNEELQEIAIEARANFYNTDANSMFALQSYIAILQRNWADFTMFVITPSIDSVSPPIVHEPERIAGTDKSEFVYPILDFGYKLSTSKAENMFSVGMSMCKLYFTIEKMVYLLIERLKAGGVDETTEVQVSFSGNELAQRKAFESIINLSYNVVINNFDPAAWGDRYLENIKRLADRGYGYPKPTPRDDFKVSHGGGGQG